MVRSQPHDTRASRFLRALLALLFLTAFAALIALLGVRYVQVGEVRVPEVLGSDVQDASRTLRALGFEVSTYTDAAATTAPDRVSAQTPAAGAVVRRGRGVALGVGARSGTEMPDLVGQTRAQATAALAAVQLEPARLAYRYAPQPEGTVLSQQPAVGTALEGAAVSLTLSLGPRPPRVALPRLVRMRPDVAQRRLEALGFRRIELVPTRLGAPGVNAQTPAAGVRTPVSAPVTLYYTVGNRQVVPVPSVVGLELQGAVDRLQAAGLRVGWVSADAFDPAKPRGVTAVTPQDYTLWGTPVTLRTNGNAGDYRVQDPAPPRRAPLSPPSQPQAGVTLRTPTGAQAPPLATGGRVIPISYDPANYSFLQGRAYDFRVEVSDDAGDRIALSRAMGPDEAVQDTVTVYGEAELRMYIDGQIVLAYNPANP